MKDVPFSDGEAFTAWMYERWVEKEQLLKHFYEHGSFPSGLAEDECTSSIPLSSNDSNSLESFAAAAAADGHEDDGQMMRRIRQPIEVGGDCLNQREQFPPLARAERPRPVELSHAYILSIHVCWILSSMFHLYLYRCLKAVVFG